MFKNDCTHRKENPMSLSGEVRLHVNGEKTKYMFMS